MAWNIQYQDIMKKSVSKFSREFELIVEVLHNKSIGVTINSRENLAE